MTTEEIAQLIDLLHKFATVPCKMSCKSEYKECPLYDNCNCELLYYVSRCLNKEFSTNELIKKLNSDFKNTKGIK